MTHKKDINKQRVRKILEELNSLIEKVRIINRGIREIESKKENFQTENIGNINSNKSIHDFYLEKNIEEQLLVIRKGLNYRSFMRSEITNKCSMETTLNKSNVSETIEIDQSQDTTKFEDSQHHLPLRIKFLLIVVVFICSVILFFVIKNN